MEPSRAVRLAVRVRQHCAIGLSHARQAAQAGGVISSPPQREADLRLRSNAGPMRTRVWWPAASGPGTGLLLFLSDPRLGELPWLRELATTARIVVVAAPCAHDEDAVVRASLREAMTALEWAADHAAQLEADPGRLIVGGIGMGAALANAAAAEAGARAWPCVARQLLIPLGVPCPDVPRSPAAAPFTVVTGDDDPWPLGPGDEQLFHEEIDVIDLARSLTARSAPARSTAPAPVRG
jgi:alpha/beta hydrolase family protein